jgi:hypothetical protein
LDVAERFVVLLERKRPFQTPRFATAWTAAVAIFFIVGSTRALTARDLGLQREAELGKWLAAEFGGDAPMALAKTMPVCGYYARPAKEVTWLDTQDDRWPAMLGNHALRLSVVESNAVTDATLAALRPAWSVLERDKLPESCRRGKFVVLVRNAETAHAASSPRKASVGR